MAEDRDPLRRQSYVLDVGVRLDAALLHLRQEEVTLPVRGEDGMFLDVQPGQLRRPLGMGLEKFLMVIDGKLRPPWRIRLS